MLKNISIRGARATALGIVLSLIPGIAVAARTQIVVQWVDGPYHLSLSQFFRVQQVFDHQAEQGGYDSDGNDFGGGTQNFFLFADDKDVAAVVRKVITMQKQKQLPDGMRIGIAAYRDLARKDWTYRAVYPISLKYFNLTYSGKS